MRGGDAGTEYSGERPGATGRGDEQDDGDHGPAVGGAGEGRGEDVTRQAVADPPE